MDVLLAISNVVSLVLNIWVVSTVVGVLTAVQILRGLFSKRGQDDPTLPVALLNCDTVARELLKISPVGVAKGWHLEDVLNGVRLWNHPLTVNRKVPLSPEASYQWNVLAATHKVELSPQEIIQSLAETEELFSWMPGLNPPITLSQSEVVDNSHSVDTLSFVLPPPTKQDGLHQLLKIAVSAVKKGSFGYLDLAGPQRESPKVINIRRKWRTVNDTTTCMICQSDAPADLGSYWVCYIFLLDKTTEISSFVSVAAIPVPGQKEKVKRTISAELCALSHHLREKKSGFYRPVNKEKFLVKNNTNPVTPSAPPTISHHPPPTGTTEGEVRAAFSTAEETGSEDRQIAATQNRTESELGAVRLPQQPKTRSRYSDVIERAVSRMLREADGTEETGWTVDGEKRGVTISKKTPGPGESPLNCVRGSGVIPVPPDFLFRFLLEEGTVKKLDNLLKEVEDIEEPEPFCRIAHLSYSPVRPTTARDFCILSYSAKVDPHTFVYTALSITHLGCPENKGFVRGELMIGGWVIRGDPENANISHAIYVTQVDLKGYVPGFVMNKVTAMQPMRVDKLREAVIPEYQRALNDTSVMNMYMNILVPVFSDAKPDPDQDGNSDQIKLTEEATGTASISNQECNGSISPDHSEDSMLRNETTRSYNESVPQVYKSDSMSQRSTTSGGETSGRNLDGYTTPDEMSSSGEGERRVPQQWTFKSIGGNPVFERMPWKYEPGTPSSVSSLTHSETAFSMPIRDSFVDFRTLANQIAASVYEETFNVSSVAVRDPSTHKFGQKGWKFQSFEKDTVILRKKKPDSPFECFIGKAIIPLSPEDVFQHIRNPTMRYSYDNMLKELEFIRRIDDDLYILHMVHETTHCLMKQARDFCLLVSERIMPDQLMIVGTSVDVPDCPVNPNVRRGRVLTSGWVLEAYKTADNQKHCSVTYLVQVDVGGAPAQLVNIISRRQPLAVAYLRDYLTGSGLLTTSIMERQTSRQPAEEDQ